MTRAERQAEYDKTANHLRCPMKWAWEGNEAALIEADEQRIREEVAETEKRERNKKMATDFTEKNPSLEVQRIVAEATSTSEMVELLRLQRLREMAQSQEPQQQQQPPATKPEDDGTLLRRAVTVNGVTRLLEAWSATGLDTLEAAFRRQS